MEIRVFTTKELLKANSIAKREGFNRFFKKHNFRDFPRHLKWPIMFHFIHLHKKGKSCKPHMRCLFEGPNAETYQIDCDMKLYDSLSTIKVAKKKEMN
jgi:hypothetical protein